MSDLREALEKLAADWRSQPHDPDSVAVTVMRHCGAQIAGALAEHPAEVDPETGFARPLLEREKVKDVVFFNVEHLSIKEAGEAADAVMELARPMPTREQIAAALSTHYHHPVFGCECTPMHDDGTKEELDGGWPEHLADIVLALVKGAD